MAAGARSIRGGRWRARPGVRDNIRGPSPPEQHLEGRIARTIEQQTAKLPVGCVPTGGAAGGSLAFQIAGKRGASNFIGRWVPTLLVLGLYNKMVKLLGSDAR